MSRIFLSHQQSSLVHRAEREIEVCDAAGHVLGRIVCDNPRGGSFSEGKWTTAGEGKPSELLVKFVSRLRQNRVEGLRDLTVNDLKDEVRIERLTEYSNWSYGDLQRIEGEAESYGGTTLLATLVDK